MSPVSGKEGVTQRPPASRQVSQFWTQAPVLPAHTLNCHTYPPALERGVHSVPLIIKADISEYLLYGLQDLFL